MSFETPAPDLKKLIAAWETWERGEDSRVERWPR